MKRRWRRTSRKEAAELNITAFMNLMVILVPFLLITAVFSRITVLELNLPAASTSDEKPKQTLQLEITIRRDALEVGDRGRGLIKTLPNTDEGYALAQLSELLKQIKARSPDTVNATVLLEPDIAYDALVQVMDTVRLFQVVEDGELVNAELFPEIAIGDATVARKKNLRASR
jgi:biopolymer transport protein ExbD